MGQIVCGCSKSECDGPGQVEVLLPPASAHDEVDVDSARLRIAASGLQVRSATLDSGDPTPPLIAPPERTGPVVSGDEIQEQLSDPALVLEAATYESFAEKRHTLRRTNTIMEGLGYRSSLDAPIVRSIGKPFPSLPKGCKLSAEAWEKIRQLYASIDADSSNLVTQEEARAFFKGAFAKLSADAMFNEVDEDGSGVITGEEFASFWVQVAASGYAEGDILTELDELIQGNAWVDWNDGRDTTAPAVLTFPKRPFLSRLSKKAWSKCDELFRRMDTDGSLRLSHAKAHAFFKGGFTKLSADAIFKQIDADGSQVITADEWMAFWVHVRSIGYKNKEILEELDTLLEGGAWREWCADEACRRQCS